MDNMGVVLWARSCGRCRLWNSCHETAGDSHRDGLAGVIFAEPHVAEDDKRFGVLSIQGFSLGQGLCVQRHCVLACAVHHGDIAHVA